MRRLTHYSGHLIPASISAQHLRKLTTLSYLTSQTTQQRSHCLSLHTDRTTPVMTTCRTQSTRSPHDPRRKRKDDKVPNHSPTQMRKFDLTNGPHIALHIPKANVTEISGHPKVHNLQICPPRPTSHEHDRARRHYNLHGDDTNRQRERA